MEDEEYVIEEQECVNEKRECINEESECIMEERECVTHAKDVLTSFEGLKNDEQFCDFILKIGEEEIPVHRMVLAACSKYFHAMFSHNTKETKTGRVEILGIEPSAGKQCLEFVYTGKIKFSRENPKDLIHAAELMQLHSLIDLYFEYLVENISTENCLEYMVMALTYNQNSFAKVFEKFLGKNFAEIIKTEDFALMSQPLLSQCFDCLRDGTQNSEKLKWEAVTTWVKADLEIREGVFPELFKMIKLKNLPTEFLRTEISSSKLVMESSECNGLLLDAYKSGEVPNGSSSVEEIATHIVVFHQKSRLLHKFDMKEMQWSRFVRVPADIVANQLDIVSLEGAVYFGTGNALTKFYKGSWTKLSATGFKSHYCRCVTSGQFVFMVTAHITVTYDSNTNTVDKTGKGCCLEDGFALCASNNCLYALGGEDTYTEAREFDLVTKSWEPICDTNYPRNQGVASFFRGKVFALGGKNWVGNTHAEIEYYEPTVDKWVVIESRSAAKNICPMIGFKAFVMQNKLYTIKRGLVEIKELELEVGEDTEISMKMDASQFCPARLV